MGKKRGEIENWLRRIFFTGKGSEYIIFIKHRVNEEEDVKPIPGELLLDIRGGYIYTKSGDQIPFHRVVEIRTKKGEIVYKRR
ncbi:MAG: RNA repair domain-containing protein [Desulfurococcaceae archaeon]